MNIEEIKFSLNFVQWLVVAVIGVVLWFVKRSSASSKEVVALSAELAAIRERLVQVEVEIKNMPTEASVRELIGKFESLAAYHEGTKQQLNAMQQGQNRLYDFLLKRGQ